MHERSRLMVSRIESLASDGSRSPSVWVLCQTHTHIFLYLLNYRSKNVRAYNFTYDKSSLDLLPFGCLFHPCVAWAGTHIYLPIQLWLSNDLKCVQNAHFLFVCVLPFAFTFPFMRGVCVSACECLSYIFIGVSFSFHSPVTYFFFLKKNSCFFLFGVLLGKWQSGCVTLSLPSQVTENNEPKANSIQ